MDDIDWRQELAKWCGMQPSRPLQFVDYSGVFSPEFVKEVEGKLKALAEEFTPHVVRFESKKRKKRKKRK